MSPGATSTYSEIAMCIASSRAVIENVSASQLFPVGKFTLWFCVL